jgi:hypothetical protein
MSSGVNSALTVGRRSSGPGYQTMLAVFWPHNGAQRCRLPCTSEHHFSSPELLQLPDDLVAFVMGTMVW